MIEPHNQIDPARLKRAARRLSRRERAVLFLSASEQLDIEAVAERLGLEPAVAERLLAGALWNLERALRRSERPWWRLW